MIINNDFKNKQLIVTQDIFMILSIAIIDETNENFLYKLTTHCEFRGTTFKSVIITAIRSEKSGEMEYEMYYVKASTRTLKDNLERKPYILI